METQLHIIAKNAMINALYAHKEFIPVAKHVM